MATSAPNAFGHNDQGSVTITDVSVSGQSFSSGKQFAVVGTPTNPWNVQYQRRTTEAIQAGDVLLADLWLRCDKTLNESNQCNALFVLENSTTYHKAVSQALLANKDWTHLYVPFVADQDYPSGGTNASLFLGYGDQTITVGQVAVYNYGSGWDIASLPQVHVSYVGMDADAPWRPVFAQRIDQVRRGDIHITVVDAQGNPVPHADVHVEMTRHDFLWGSAVSSGIIAAGEDPAEYDRYTQEILDLFNVVGAFNAFKWKPWAGDWGPNWDTQRAMDTANWALSHGLDFRSHVVLWPGWRHLPTALQDLSGDPAALRAAVNAHIDEALNLTKNSGIRQWDLVNEPYDNHDLMDILGDDEMIAWFQRAHSVDPTVKLFLNDYGILTGGEGNTGHRDNLEYWLKLLTDAGAPIDGVGLQSHFGTALTGPEYVYSLLDRYATQYDLEAAVTEYDISPSDPDLAACFTHDFMTAIFAHPKTTTFVMWGFKGPEDPIYDDNWNLRSSGRVWKDLLYGRWWTDETAVTNSAGKAAVRGFYGRYTITVTSGGSSAQVTVDHTSAAPASVVVTI